MSLLTGQRYCSTPSQDQVLQGSLLPCPFQMLRLCQAPCQVGNACPCCTHSGIPDKQRVGGAAAVSRAAKLQGEAPSRGRGGGLQICNAGSGPKLWTGDVKKVCHFCSHIFKRDRPPPGPQCPAVGPRSGKRACVPYPTCASLCIHTRQADLYTQKSCNLRHACMRTPVPIPTYIHRGDGAWVSSAHYHGPSVYLGIPGT